MALKNSILIIEDEWIEQELLAAQVKEYVKDKFEILAANNGIRALELCQEHSPSILLVDINIPGLNGLSLIRTLRGFQYPGKIIITTAYDLFDYAKEAISMGVDSYLLKPIDETELNNSLQNCLDNIEQEMMQRKDKQSLQIGIQSAFSYAESYLVNDLLSGNIPANALQNAFFWPSDGMLQVRFLQFRCAGTDQENWQNYFLARCRSLFSQRHLLLTAKVGQDIIIMIQPEVTEETVFLNTENYFYCWLMLNEIPDSNIDFLYSSGLHASFNELYQAFLEAPPQKQNQYSPNKKLCVNIPNFSDLCVPKARNKLRQKWLQRMSEGNAYYIVSMLKRVMNKESYWPAVLLFLEVLWHLDKKINLKDIFDIFCSAQPFDKLEHWIDDYFSLSGHKMHSYVNHHEAIAERVMRILHERFDEQDLSEKTVAEEFGFSQEHFSRIVKKEFGNSFINILTQLRLEHAKKLLLDPSLTLKEISQSCGYQSRKYFLSVFKKRFGCTPSEFRERHTNQTGGTPS